MSNLQIFRGSLQTLIALIWVLFFALFAAGCGGGTGSSTPGSSSGTTSTSPPTSAGSSVLKADAGSVCETLINGAVYTKTPPTLSCNKGSDPNTAYLDGSKSTSADGQPLSYAWSFVSKPTGSNAVLTGANTAKPTFVPDKAGSYTVQLVVSENGVSSPRAVALVVALDNAALNPNLTVNPAATPYHFHGGLSNNCTVCHSGTYPDLLTKTSTHIASSNMCQACHSPLGFNVKGFVDHAEVFGKCSDCHDGVIATGKSPTHIVTTQECSDCHSTTSFLTLNGNGTFDHSNITEPCSACHNGTVAIGTSSAPNGHPSISEECNACHTTATFAAPFVNHSDPKAVVPGTCGKSSCHADGSSYTDVNGNTVTITSKATAPNQPHPSTGNITIACDLCHNTTSYNLGGIFDHGVLARHPIQCSSCHDGINAKGKITNHIATTSDCSACHNTTTFVGGFVDHTSTDVTSKACTDCHDGTHTWTPLDMNGNPLLDANGKPVVNTIPGAPLDSTMYSSSLVTIHTNASAQSCGNCHVPGGSFTLATVDHSGFGTVGNITLPSGESCSACHDGTVPNAQDKPVGHMVTTDDCGVCHDPQSDTFAGAGFDHSTLSITGNTSTPTCTSCHDGKAAKGQSLTHVPLPTPGQDCLVCHGTGFTSFAMPTFDHAAAGITSNCSSCHNGKTYDTTLVITKPTGHIPVASADCSKCHADTTNGPGINGTSSSGYATATPFVNTVHPAYTTGCRSCHNATYDNSIYLAKSHPTDSVHSTVDANGWECNACHTTTGNFKETNPVNHQDPTIKTQACVSCHVAGNTTEPIGKGPSHPSTSDTCQDCHQAGGSFTAGFDHTTLDKGGSNYGLACTTCHDGVTATGKAQNHVATTRDCVSCHAGYPPTASTFAGGTFDHTGPEMTGRLCMDCHDGTILGALGKSAKPDHVVTSADCAACHTTTAFKPATTFDHTGVTSGCADAGCHNEGSTSAKSVSDDLNAPTKLHIPIKNNGQEVNCYSCHKNPGGTFANATMDHSVVTFEACESCHDGKHDGANTAHVATTKSSTHFVTSVAACASCHKSTSAWTVGVSDYKHTSGGGFPGTHNANKVTSCSQCHNNSPANADISTFPLSPYGSSCAACHYKTGQNGHGNPLPSNRYNCGNSGCHRVSGSSFG